MDYERIYYDLIDYCKNTNVNERLLRRNQSDIRIKNEYVYQENHHIVPTHDGGLDEENNMVFLLPEEHLLAHQLRWKAYKQRGDMLAVIFSLNCFEYKNNKGITEAKLENRINKAIKQGYIWIKQNSYEVRQTHGWHSLEGRNRISESRKGTMPVVDSITKESIGSVRTDHPNVLNGNWQHHSKGSTLTISHRKKISIKTKGELNPKYSGLSDEDIVNYGIELFNKIGEISSLNDLRIYVKKFYNKDIPKSFSKFRFPNNSYYEIIQEKTKSKYNGSKRGEAMKIYKTKFKEIMNDSN